MMVLVVVLAAGAGWLALPATRVGAQPGRPSRPGPRRSPRAVGVLAGLTAAAACLSLGAGDMVLCAIALGVLWMTWRLVARARRVAFAERRSEQVLLACEAMASDLAAGQPPMTALGRAAEEWPELAPAAAAARLDADVPDVLRSLAGLSGAGQLKAVAAAWQVAHRSGASLATALSRVTVTLREERRTTRLVAAELAAARATVRMMAVLPALVLLLGVGVGGDPVGFLTGTPIGLACLVIGLVLTFLGIVWLNRIADGVLGR